jgi:hypothetical protein
MSKEIVMGEPEDALEGSLSPDPIITDPDEYFAKNSFRMIYQTNNFLLPQIRDLIDKGEVLNLRPEYQRRLRWSVPQKSRLIESLLLNIPVPPVFLYETRAARYEVMDGQQRLNAVSQFLAGDFALSGLPILKPLNGLRYSRCPPRIKRSLDRANVAAIVLLLESDTDLSSGQMTLTDIRRFVFDRLNTGGTRLNPQEIRNAIYPGPFNQALINLTRFDLFTEVFDIPPYIEADPNDYYENPDRQKNTLYSSMNDCQLVLRYFALKDDENIRGSMKSMLDRAMESRVTIKPEEAQALESEYKECFAFLYALFDKSPFTLPLDGKKSTRVSAAIYDATMVAMNRLWNDREHIASDKMAINRRMVATLADPAQISVMTGRGNTAQAVRDRIALAYQILCPQA